MRGEKSSGVTYKGVERAAKILYNKNLCRAGEFRVKSEDLKKCHSERSGESRRLSFKHSFLLFRYFENLSEMIISTHNPCY